MREAIEQLKNTYLIQATIEREQLDEQLKLNVESDEEYCTLMWLLGVWYQQQENKNAATYCCLRANEIWCMNALKPKQRRSTLNFTNFVMPAEMEQFIQGKLAFMKEKNKQIFQRLLYLSILFGSLAFLLSYFLLQMNLISCLIEWACFSFLTFYLSYGRMKDRFYIRQSEACAKFLDETALSFDQHYL